MVSIKQTSLIIAVIVSIIMPLMSDRASALSSDQRDAVVQNCGNIKQSLTVLQRADSRTRTYLGSAYEAISGRFITPLNLRLVKNGLPSTELFRIQNEFTAAHNDFRNNYIDYMRTMDDLIATDCATVPDDFYHKLESAREKREKLRISTKILAELVDAQYKTVEELRAGL